MAIAANDYHGSACRFIHEEACGGGEFIGDRQDCGAEKFAMAVARAAQIDERGHALRADGYVGEAQTPRAAERIADDDSETLAGLLAQGRRLIDGRNDRDFRGVA